VSSERDRPGDRQVYRTPGSMVLWWAWLVFAAVSLVWLAVSGRSHSALVTALVIAAITGVAYGCAQRPRIVADAAGLTVVNPLRVHTVPWPAVTKVDLAQTARVHYTRPGMPRDGVVHSWAVQSSGRARTRSELRARRAAQPAPRQADYAKLPGEARAAVQGSAAEFIVRQLSERVDVEHQRAGPGSPPVSQVRWAWAQIAAMTLPLLVLIVVAAA
jgi:Bacterial PH domain